MKLCWVGLGWRLRKKPGASQIGRELARTIGAGSVLLLSAIINFVVHPDALANVVAHERPIVGFIAIDEPSGPAQPTPQLNEADVRLLAATVWGEARSEGESGMRAVAHVIVNRLGPRFGGDIASVILAPAQFSAWNEGDRNRPLVENPETYATSGINLETWQAAQQIAREVLSGQSVDPTSGALFYHTRAVRPWWARYGHGRRIIGEHVFYADVPDRRPRHGVTPVAYSNALPAPASETTAEAAQAPHQLAEPELPIS